MQSSWLESINIKRAANYSTVVVVETNDDRRFQEYMGSREKRTVDGRTQYHDTLVWDTYLGFRQYNEGGVGDLGTNLMEGEMEAIKNFLLPTRGNEARNKVVVIRNILTANDLPLKAINTWSMDDAMFTMRQTVIIFLPDRSLIPPKVLEKCILVSPPYSTNEERKEIISDLGDSFDIKTKDLGLESMVQATAGLDLNQTEAVVAETLQAYKLGRLKSIDTSVISDAKADIINKSNVLEIKRDLQFGFERIGGYEPLKKLIRDTIILPLKEPERAKKLGLDLPRGLILFGPGGTGKTVITKAMAKEIGFPFVTLKPENFMNSLVGQSERNLRDAFRLMREMAPVVCFIDEIDRLGGRAGGAERDGGTSSRIFSMFLEELGDEDRNYFMVGATNQPFLDPAFIRPGRFDSLIPMLSPDLEARKEIIKIHLNVVRKVPNDVKTITINALASCMEGWKGNMIEELVKRAIRLAFESGQTILSENHLMDAYHDYVVNNKSLQADEQKYIEAAKELCNSKRFLAAMESIDMKKLKKARGEALVEVVRT